jgi:putative SOS response-associated peptidase YedK
MCNDYRQEVDLASIEEDFEDLKISIDYPEGRPNLEPRADIRITDPGPIVRLGAGGRPELVQRRWSWPNESGAPVFNYRSDGREFRSKRCLIIADGFYEFTTPEDKSKKLKDKWLFTVRGQRFFCIAGIWRSDKVVGEAFTMLTMPPDPTFSAYHKRQIVLLERADWTSWLDPSVPAQSVLGHLPSGSLQVEQVG